MPRRTRPPISSPETTTPRQRGANVYIYIFYFFYFFFIMYLKFPPGCAIRVPKKKHPPVSTPDNPRRRPRGASRPRRRWAAPGAAALAAAAAGCVAAREGQRRLGARARAKKRAGLQPKKGRDVEANESGFHLFRSLYLSITVTLTPNSEL